MSDASRMRMNELLGIKKEKMQSSECDCRWHHIKGKSALCQELINKTQLKSMKINHGSAKRTNQSSTRIKRPDQSVSNQANLQQIIA